jgi:hypothetical protein
MQIRSLKKLRKDYFMILSGCFTKKKSSSAEVSKDYFMICLGVLNKEKPCWKNRYLVNMLLHLNASECSVPDYRLLTVLVFLTQ